MKKVLAQAGPGRHKFSWETGGRLQTSRVGSKSITEIMKKSLLLFLMFGASWLTGISSLLGSTVLYRVVVNDRWGFIDKGGKMVIPTQFDRAGSFSEGLAEVRLGRWGYVDSSGKIVINPQFDRASAFNDGLAPVEFGGRYGYVDTAGKY